MLTHLVMRWGFHHMNIRISVSLFLSIALLCVFGTPCVSWGQPSGTVTGTVRVNENPSNDENPPNKVRDLLTAVLSTSDSSVLEQALTTFNMQVQQTRTQRSPQLKEQDRVRDTNWPKDDAEYMF